MDLMEYPTKKNNSTFLGSQNKTSRIKDSPEDFSSPIILFQASSTSPTGQKSDKDTELARAE